MIYVVTTQILPESNIYTKVSIEESLKLLQPLKEVGLDTETSGLDPYTSSLLIVQLGCFDFQIIIDCTTIDIIFYKEYLESDRLFLLWNAKFDLKFLFHKKIIVKKVYDGFLAEKLMYLGYPSGQHSMSLSNAGYNYCNVYLDKSIRTHIAQKGLSEPVIQYSADDVKYLPVIKDKQAIELVKKGLSTAIIYENHFVPWIAYTEYCGVKLDIVAWKAKMAKDNARLNKAIKELNAWMIKNMPDSPYLKIDRQGNLFTGFNTEPVCILNWSSSKQVILLFESLGFNLWIPDKQKGGMKKSVSTPVIKPQKHLSTLAPIYLEYKAAEKVVTTYGQNVLDQINPISGRIHTNYFQLGTDTSRMSSGGKDKVNKVEYINFQNFPSDRETRACFIAEDGNLWISADYAAQESRIMADVTNDEVMLELIKSNKDIHSYVTKLAYPDIIKDTPLEEIKNKFGALRNSIKSEVEFPANYGGDHNTIASHSGKSIEEAKKLYDAYMDGFEGIKNYQKRQRVFVMKHGYILINPITGHKAFIWNYDELMEIKKGFTQEFWQNYRYKKEHDPDHWVVKDVRKFFKDKSNAEKHSINYPMQGTAALQLKLAMYYFYEWIKANNLLFIVKMNIPCHDEMNVECPEHMANTVKNVLEQCMKKGGEFFTKNIEMPADAVVGKHWIH